MSVLGIDIGGSGIKGAVVDTEKGELITPRFRFDTPSPAKPAPMAEAVAKIIKKFGWQGPIGVGFPGIIRQQEARSAANVDESWLGVNLRKLLGDATGCPIRAINDADAAGVAEIAFGAGKNKSGTILLLTLGTGIGSALFIDGTLVPNTEFGHLKFNKGVAEDYAAASARKENNLDWPVWAKRVNKLLLHLDFLLSPDLFIIGGGVSKKFDRIQPKLSKQLTVVPAELLNEAGIIGAAYAAAQHLEESELKVEAFEAPTKKK